MPFTPRGTEEIIKSITAAGAQVALLGDTKLEARPLWRKFLSKWLPAGEKRLTIFFPKWFPDRPGFVVGGMTEINAPGYQRQQYEPDREYVFKSFNATVSGWALLDAQGNVLAWERCAIPLYIGFPGDMLHLEPITFSIT
jgi:hypothetical protein